jgi:hypothetical protein
MVGGRFYLRPPSADVAFATARRKYEGTVSRRLGVKLGTLCWVESITYCYVFRPSSALEAEYTLMPDGLKLSVRTPLPEGVIVSNEVEWQRLLESEQPLSYKRSMFS